MNVLSSKLLLFRGLDERAEKLDDLHSAFQVAHDVCQAAQGTCWTSYLEDWKSPNVRHSHKTSLICVGRGGACWESLSCQVERAILVSLIWSTNTWTSIRLDDSFEVVLSIQSGTFVVAQSSMGLDDWLWMMSMKGPLGEMLDECIMESVERLVQVVKIFYPPKWNGQMIIKE